MVPGFKITVKAIPAIARQICLFQAAPPCTRRDTPGVSQVSLLGRGAILDLPFRPHQKVLAALLAVVTGSEVAMDAAFDVPAPSIKKT